MLLPASRLTFAQKSNNELCEPIRQDNKGDCNCVKVFDYERDYERNQKEKSFEQDFNFAMPTKLFS